ncbi:MAG: response regulator transcription factor [Oceanospirillaceae bacterium]|nr:response regulator transcription factor [Oceanospirillaceae bacterium]
MTSSEKIIIADDHPLFRQALSAMLHSHFTNAQLYEAETIPELDKLLQLNNIDLILLDLDIPGAQGFNTLINLRSDFPEIGVVIISGIEDSDTINKAMHHGAAGFIPKSTPVVDMVGAISQVFAGNLWTPSGDYAQGNNNTISDERIDSLTPQQHKILLMFAEGLLNKQIAYDLGLAESTIKSHASTIFLKLGVRNRTQAVIVLNEILTLQNSFGPTLAN